MKKVKSDKRNEQMLKVSKLSSDGAAYFKDLLTSGTEGVVGKGLELGVGALMARTALRHLPVPLNFVAPFIAEKVIMKHGIENGRDLLLKGLRWIKKATDENPASGLQTAQL
jgi:hypothetical protein